MACTHYPLLIPKIQNYIPANIQLLSQGQIVANSLANYLKRHPQIEAQLLKEFKKQFFTSGCTQTFDTQATIFFGENIHSNKM